MKLTGSLKLNTGRKERGREGRQMDKIHETRRGTGWEEEGSQWRILEVTGMDTIKTHYIHI